MAEQHSTSREVEQLLENARLRDALEPFIDDSLNLLTARRLTTPEENDFLASMLAWERAPMLPISQWFEPELSLPNLEALNDEQVHALLWDTIRKLFEKRIVIQYTDHLSDRQLYCILLRDILPSLEKRLDSPRAYLHWQCIDPEEDIELWLRYYATNDERQSWEAENGQPAPPAARRPHPRRLPRP
jgi:hypothetical protein